MKTTKNTVVEIEVSIHQIIEKVWYLFTQPERIVKWNYAAETWHSPRAVNDLRVGGKFCYRMEAVDGNEGFDFEGIYDEVESYKTIAYTLGDNRKVKTTFEQKKTQTIVKTVFEVENVYTPEQQREGWQAILNNFKKYAEEII